MLARVVIIVIVNAAFFAAVLWLIPIENILTARGYTPTQVAALQAAPATKATASQADKTGDNESAPVADKSTSTNVATSKDTPSVVPAQIPRLVATAAVNVRTGQSTDTAIVGQIAQGDVVEVLQTPGGDWVQIRRGELTGWVYRPLLKKTSAAAARTAEPAPRLVATATVNVRSGQSTDYPVVGQISLGGVVTVLETPGGDWIRIQHGDLRGWTYRPLFKPTDK